MSARRESYSMQHGTADVRNAASEEQDGAATVSHAGDRSHPDISVVVLTYNRRDEVCETVAHLLALPEKPRIIVVDNASSDGTTEAIHARYPSVRVLRCAENLGAAGRNEGVKHVETPYVAFSDDDTHWRAGSLDIAASVLDVYPRVGVLTGRVVVEDRRSGLGVTGAGVAATEVTDPTCLLMAASPLPSGGLPGRALVGFMAGACVFRTTLFRTLGGYDRRLFIGGEESLLSMDVMAHGKAIVYCPEITVSHSPSDVRDAPARRALLSRNAAWIACMRLPWSDTHAAVRDALRFLHHAGCPVSAYWDFGKGLLCSLSRRRLLPEPVLAMRAEVRMAEAANRSPA